MALRARKVVVLFNSYCVCRRVLCACQEKRFNFISTRKDNRDMVINGRRRKVGTCKKDVFEREKKRKLFEPKSTGAVVKVSLSDGDWLPIKKLGREYAFFSRKNSGPKVLGIVTDDLDLSSKRILEEYAERPAIAKF